VQEVAGAPDGTQVASVGSTDTAAADADTENCQPAVTGIGCEYR